VRDALAAETERRKGFDLHARGLGAFPNESSPRILWAAVDDRSGALGKLAADVDKCMESLGFDRETRAFSPHVTIARVKEGKGGPELFAPFKSQEFGNFLVREVILYESSVTSKGSEYSPLARLPLDAPAYRAERQTREVEGEGPQEQEEPEENG
jgi:2'-5' RNA ligase